MFVYAAAVLAIIGMSMMVQLTGSVSVVQAVVDDDKRRRIMSNCSSLSRKNARVCPSW